jgi:hypothetical protein
MHKCALCISQLLNAAVNFADNFGGNIATQINLAGLQSSGII